MRQVTPFGYILCDRVQCVERFATHPRHFASQVPPEGGGGGSHCSIFVKPVVKYWSVFKSPFSCIHTDKVRF